MAELFDQTHAQITAKVEAGEIAWAFDIGGGVRCSEPRLLSYAVMETKIGPIEGIGATRDLKLPEVINLVLPQRDIRSTELARLLSCEHQHVYRLAGEFRVARKPAAKDGPHSYTVFNRASVARFLKNRRMI